MRESASETSLPCWKADVFVKGKGSFTTYLGAYDQEDAENRAIDRHHYYHKDHVIFSVRINKESRFETYQDFIDELNKHQFD